MVVRGKFRCSSVTHRKNTPNPEEHVLREFQFDAIYDESLPEDRRYAKYSPSGKITLLVDNPNIDWQPGHYYYLDFTPVD